MYTKVKTDQEIAAMRTSGGMLAQVLDVVLPRVQPGISTKELADLAKAELQALGGQPPFLGYYGFPDVICISVNEEVVHGIPRSDKIIRQGDIVSLDFGVSYDGMITDSARSVIAGNVVKKEDADLVATTKASLEAGIAVLKDGVQLGTIGHAVEEMLSERKYGIVRDLVGHGVGHELHEDPNIPNYGRAHTGDSLKAGMTIAIEPMATRGGHKVVMMPDGWTVSTADGSRAAHFEHTILITPSGFEVLTESKLAA